MSAGESRHPREELQALLDARLEGEARAAVERHVAECGRCRGELAALRWAKERVAGLPEVPAPPGLETRLRAALDAEDAARRDSRTGGLPLWLPVAAAALVLALLAVPLWWSARIDVVEQVRGDLARVADGRLALEAEDLAPPRLESWFAERGLPFEVRVFDLGGMEFQLSGARVGRVGGEPSALYAYRGPGGELVVCQMYPGELPAADEVDRVDRREDGVAFHTVRRGGAVLVFWREGEVVCVLASRDLPEEQVRALAFAKAEPVRSA